MRRSRHTEFREPKLVCTSPISVAISVSLGEVTTTLPLLGASIKLGLDNIDCNMGISNKLINNSNKLSNGKVKTYHSKLEIRK